MDDFYGIAVYIDTALGDTTYNIYGFTESYGTSWSVQLYPSAPDLQYKYIRFERDDGTIIQDKGRFAGGNLAFQWNGVPAGHNQCYIVAYTDNTYSTEYARYSVVFDRNYKDTEVIYTGEYDYTEYFEDLVAGQTNQTTLLTNVKNEVIGLADTVTSNHLLLFSAFLLGVGVLVRKILKGVILNG